MMGIAINATYWAVLAPTPPVPKACGKARARMRYRLHAGISDDPEAVPPGDVFQLMRQAASPIAWIDENIPATLVELRVNRDGLAEIVATFVSETDATAFKVRVG